MRPFKFSVFFAFLFFSLNQTSWAMTCDGRCCYEEVQCSPNISFKILKSGDCTPQIQDNENCTLWTDFTKSLAVISNDLYYCKNVIKDQVLQAQNEKEKAQKTLDSFLTESLEEKLGQDQIEAIYYAARLLRGHLKESDSVFVHLLPELKKSILLLLSGEKDSQFLHTVTQLRTTVDQSEILLSKKQQESLIVNKHSDLSHTLELEVASLLSTLSCSPKKVSIKVLRPGSNNICSYGHNFSCENSSFLLPVKMFDFVAPDVYISPYPYELISMFNVILEKIDTLKSCPLFFKDLINSDKEPEPFEKQFIEIKMNQFHSLQINAFRLMSAFSAYINEGKPLPIEEKKDIGTETF